MKASRRAPASILLARGPEEAWRHLYLTLETGDLIMVLGAGDQVSIIPRIKSDMAKGEQHRPDPISLANFSFFRTGGVTYGRHLRSLDSQTEARNHLIIGAGSNTWLSDCATDADIIQAPPDSQASRPGAALLADHPELAFMAGIPGTVGGWAKMNAGAFGDSFGNHIEYVVADGKRIPGPECGFAYRTSSIPGLITEVVLKPSLPQSGAHGSSSITGRSDPPPEAKAPPATPVRKRFPPRTCGSVFKNPSPDMPAGRLLEEAGAKSLRVGGACVWSEHANVIVAMEGCTSSDILALARIMAARVRDRFGVSLVPEIRGLVT